MEGMFWPTMLAFAPLWAWIPLGIAQLVMMLPMDVLKDWPLWARFWPAYLYAATFLPFVGLLIGEYAAPVVRDNRDSANQTPSPPRAP